MEERRYCPSCGTEVDLERSLESGYVFIACKLCGLGLGVRPSTSAEVRELTGPVDAGPLARVDVVKQKPALAAVEERASGVRDARAEPPAPTSKGPASKVPSTPPPRQMRRVYLVEDSAFLRQLTRDLLLERQLAREVIDLPDGPAFVEAFARELDRNEKPDLVVLDVRMPGLDGREAAYAIRAMEAACGQKRTPILFFSAVLCDEAFKVDLQALGSARYVRKSDTDVQRLGERVAEVLARLVGTA